MQGAKEGAGIPSISKDKLSKIDVPLLTRETQERIVEILDKFTECVTELQTELQNRVKQYDYYRNLLLSEEYLNKLSKKLGEDGGV